jgi:surfeit locus 1 family protein
MRPALGPTLFTIPALILLLALGTWQVQRLFWKRDLIAAVEAGIKAPPVDLPGQVTDPQAWHYRHVTLRGSFDHAREFHVMSQSQRGNFGYQVIVPLKRSDGAGYVFVDRGWVPPDKKAAETRREGLVQGEQVIHGIARVPPQRGWMTPDNRPDENLWFYPDLAAMARLAGDGAVPGLIVDADDAPVPGGAPKGGQTKLEFPNNHLAYAVTWYGGAVALAIIYVLWHRRRARETAAKAIRT